MNVGESQSFAYTGGIQTFTVPESGLYKLEVWGGQGQSVQYGWWDDDGNHQYGTVPCNKGGYSIGYKKLKKGTVLYIVCGGVRYNGGGYGASDGNDRCGNGAGATHIAKVTGLLADIGKDVFDQQGLIVAGGSGGSFGNVWNGGYNPGGAGGGLAGGGAGGGQSGSASRFGLGESGGTTRMPGGGGGYYGGSSNGNSGGGSGWIGGVPEITYKGVTYSPSTTNGVNGGNGKATITFIAKGFPTIHAFGKDIIGGYAYGKEISDIKAFGKDLA